MGEKNNISATEYGNLLAESMKKNNYEIAKELAESRKLYAMMLKERNYLHSTNTNLVMQNNILKKYIATTIRQAKEALNSIVAASNGLTTIICSEPSSLGNFEKSSSINHSNMQKVSVSPMVRGHTIMKPIIRLNKLRNLKLDGLSTYQQNISAVNISPSTIQSDESAERQEDYNEFENDENEMVEEHSDDASSNSNGYISPDRFETIAEEDEENMEVRDEMVAENSDDASSNSDGYITPDRFETIAEEDEENMDVRDGMVAENSDDTSSNSDGYISPDKFETIAEEDKENMDLRDNVETNVSDYIDVVPSIAGTFISTSFRNVKLRVSTRSQEIEALTGRVSSATQEQNSPQSIVNSNFHSPIVVRRKLKRLISPSNFIHSARKKANIESPKTSSNETENEMYISQTARDKISATRKINVEDETHVPRITRKIMKSIVDSDYLPAEESLPVTENESFVPRMTRSRMKSAKGEVSVPKITIRKAGIGKTLEISCNTTESDYGITSRNTESSTLINNFDHSVAFSDNTLKSALMSGSVNLPSVKIRKLRANNSMDETIDMNTLITSTPYNRNKSVFNENSSLSQDRGRNPIARNDCSVILNRIVVDSPKTRLNKIITGTSGSQSKKKSSEPSQREILKEPSLISVSNRPKRKTTPLNLKEPSLVS